MTKDTSATQFGQRNYLFGAIGIVLAVIVYLLVPGEAYPSAPAMAGVVTLMAVWWIFEAVPIPVTSLLPLLLFPVLGILDMSATGANYGDQTIFLFLGGFILALGLQESGVHKRIALRIVSVVGGQPGRLVLGFMISAAAMSMWISNTATVMVMLPIALSILEQAKEMNAPAKAFGNFALALMLGIAYAADMGGMATFIGTAPNLVFRRVLTDQFPGAGEPGFLDWLIMGLPLAIVFVTTGWLLLTKVIFRLPKTNLMGGDEIIRKNILALGNIRRDEILAASVFGLAALLWLTGSDIKHGDDVWYTGWRTLLDLPDVKDSTVAIGAALLLFMIPSQSRPGQALMTWPVARTLPWGILLLFGGGFAISDGFKASGLSELVGHAFAGIDLGSPILLIIVVCFILTFLTEITSNTATTNLILPILAKASVAMGIDPRVLMIPATLSASCAFMMPVASPTQAIVFGSGYVPIRQMIRAGIWFNLLGILLVTLVFVLLSNFVWGIDLNAVPDWALQP